MNTLQTTTEEVIKQLSHYVLQQQVGNNQILMSSDADAGHSTGASDRNCVTSTPELENGLDNCGVCFQHDVLDNVVMVKGRGPCSINYEAARGEGGVLREVVVSRKCAEAVLRGAHVCGTKSTLS